MAESTALCPQVTETQLACVKAVAAEPALTWLLRRWGVNGVRALFNRAESAEALVSTIKERHETHPVLVKLAMGHDSGAVSPPLPPLPPPPAK